MKQNEADRLALHLAAKYGLPIKAVLNSSSDKQCVFLQPNGVHPNEGFQVSVQIGWRSLIFDFLPGRFAADYLEQMANTSLERKAVFASIVQEIFNKKGVINFRINEEPFNPVVMEKWPSKWKSFTFSLKKAPLEINTEDHGLTEQIINIWAERFWGCIIALAPLEEIDEVEEITGLPEGAMARIVINRYERNRFNRTICLNFHGTNCKACDIDFRKFYGPIGEGFIHVHHIVPVSLMGDNYIVNPIKDLIPVCPNCHAMLHKRTPPLTIQELKGIVSNHLKQH